MSRYLLALVLFLMAGTNLKAQYCTANLYAFGCMSSNYIRSFSTSSGIGNIVNLGTGCGANNQSYTYYSNQTHVSTAGSSVSFKIVNSPTSYQNYKIWVDWNNNSSFTDVGEEVYSGSISQGDSVTATFLIPATAATGMKRMRVRSSYYTSNFTACSNELYGEVEDYNISIISSTPCSPTPVAGTAVSSMASVCPGNLFSVYLNGYTLASGSTIQWQSKPVSSTVWTNIAGATNTVIPVINQTSATDYRAYIICGSTSDTSSVVSVLQNANTQCYCSPNTGTPLVTMPGNQITNVSISSTTLNYSTTTAGSNGYSQVSPTSPNGTATLIPGDPYVFSASVLYFVSSAGLWFDFNQNGLFETTEKVPVTLNNNQATASFTVPYNTAAGQIGMRFFVSDYGNVSDPCTLQSDGEVEDYTLTIMSIPACSGSPSAGLATAPANTCPNSTFNVSLAGSTIASGLTYQWQSKSSTSSAWTDITGATTKVHAITGQTATTEYRAVVTCGNNSDTSTAVTVSQNAVTQCYCSPNNGNPLVTSPYNYLTNVSVVNTTLNYSSSNVVANGYSLVAPTPASNTATMNPGEFYIFNAAINTNVTTIGLWIDYNQNGTFETTEQIPVTVYLGAGTATASFTVPATASAGVTGMRVIATNSMMSTPCATMYSGEVEDFTITMVPLPACSGTPVAGTATSTQSSICPNTPFTLSLTGTSAVSGLSYQWQSKLASSSTWQDISGATTKLYVIANQTASTDYRAIVSCGTNTDTSAIVSVTQNSIVQCYCSPNNGFTFTNNGANTITAVSILGTGLNYSSSIAPTNGYTLVPATPSSNTATLVPGQSYIVNVSHTTSTSSGGLAIWIDFNQNGYFDNAEALTLTINPSTMIASASFTVPANAVAGTTGMRVMGSQWNAYSPCLPVSNGEVEDYTISISGTGPCTGAPVAGTTASTMSTVCPNSTFTLYLDGATVSYGLSYQWQSKPASSTSWTNIAGATALYYTVSNQSTATDYRAIVQCNTNADTSAPVSVAQNPFLQCYCSPSTGVVLVSWPSNNINNVSIPGTTLNSSSSTVPVSGYTLFPATSSFNTATLHPGQSYTMNVSIGSSWGPDVVMWIDYNQSGSFDPSEKINLSFNMSTNMASASFVIPQNAVPGSTGLRVSLSDGGSITDACTMIYDGEVEDYHVNIVVLPACSGTPVVGVATASLYNVCPNIPVNLSLTGTSAVSGLTYQWQSRPTAGGLWTNISGATTKNYTLTSQTIASDYRAVVTCSSSSDTSALVPIGQNPFAQCYCSPVNGTTLVNYSTNYISNVSILNTPLNASTWSTPTNGYTLQSPGSAFNTATLMSGQTYTFNASVSASWLYVSFWIDYNQSGTFDPSEKISTLINSSNVATATFTIPTNAVVGATGLRVSVSDNPVTLPCNMLYFGEVEDYTVTLDAPCSAPTLNAATQITASSATVNWNAVAGAANYEYVVDQNSMSPAGAGTVVNGTSFQATGLSDATTYYFHLRTYCGNNEYSSWSNQMFSTFPTSIGSIANDNSMLEVFPSPAREKITIRLKKAKGGTITLLDMKGKVLGTYSAEKAETVIDISSLAQGMYLIRYNNARYTEFVKINKL